MSRIIVQSLEGSIQRGFGLVNQFLEVCPEAVWAKKFGGWPVWQQLYHTFASMDFFLPETNSAPVAPLFASDVAELKSTPPGTPEKSAIREVVAKAQAKAVAYAASLDDAALAQKNEGISSRIGREFTHAATLSLIAGHTMYHLGSCDAALREQGLPGVF
jgi:uncharacterized damage-inducible protein DinB